MAVGSMSRFSGRVENYLKYRPSYPKKLIDYLYNECGFSRESVIADIGSGTGVFSRLLLERGSRVVAIEPNDDMRQAAERILCDEFSRFVSFKACAENTTLSEASVHHIVCAQSFHWFDMNKCRDEFARILRPGGSLLLVYNKRLTDDDAFASGYDALVQRYAKDYATVGHQNLQELDYAAIYNGLPYALLTIPNQQILDFDGVRGRLLSNSYMPDIGEAGHEEMLDELRSLFELYSQTGKILMKYVTEARIGQLHTA